MITIKGENLEDLKKTGIYCILNIVNGKKYIGSTKKSFYTRLKQHYQKLNNNKHHCIKLQNAWNKYGEEAFIFIIEEVICDFSTLLEREKFFIIKNDCINNGYNSNPDPNFSPMFNESSRTKSSITHKNWWKSKKEGMSEEAYKEFCKKYVHSYGKLPWNKGIKMTEEQTKKMHKPKIHGVSEKMKEVYVKNAVLAKDRSDYIIVFDINKTWLNTFYCISDLIEYSKSEYNILPIIPSKGKERFGKTLNSAKVLNHLKDGTSYKGLFFKRAPKSWKLSYANAVNSWKADQEPIMSQAESTLSEGAETSGEVKSS